MNSWSPTFRAIFSAFLLGVLLFVLFPYAAKAKGAGDSFAGQKNKAPGKQQNDVIDPSKSASYLGHWFLVGGGFHYNSYPVADYLPVTRELSWDAALEYSMRLTRFSELSFLLDYQSLHPESLEGHQIGYSLSYKYHLAGLTIPDFFSFYFEFSLGLADYLHEDITAMRTAGSSVGLGGQFYLGDRWLVRLSSRYRWLRYSLPESAGDSPEINSLVFYLSMGMRHLRFDG